MSVETPAVSGQKPAGSLASGCIIINSVHAPTTLWIGCSDARVPVPLMWSSTWMCQRRCRCPVPPIQECKCPPIEVCRCPVPPTPGCRCPFPPIPGCQCIPPPRVFPPEQTFVHRNIANQFHSTDDNAVSVLRYGITGIDKDPVKEVRVVGHTDCGGIKGAHGAAHGNPITDPTLARWLGPLTQLARDHMGDSVDQLAERNVRQQVQNVRAEVAQLPRKVPVNGYLYNVLTGELKSIECI